MKPHLHIIDDKLFVVLYGKTYETSNALSVTVSFTRDDVAAMEREFQALDDAKERLNAKDC